MEQTFRKEERRSLGRVLQELGFAATAMDGRRMCSCGAVWIDGIKRSDGNALWHPQELVGKTVKVARKSRLIEQADVDALNPKEN